MKKNLSQYKRILIVGDAGRGKSTLAQKLSKQLNIPWYATDDFYWDQKFTVKADSKKSLENIRKIYQSNSWIVEGTTTQLLTDGFSQADLIVHLRFSNIFSQWWNLLERHSKRSNERFIDLVLLMRHVFYKRFKLGYKKNDQTMRELLQPYQSKVIELSNFRQINQL